MSVPPGPPRQPPPSPFAFCTALVAVSGAVSLAAYFNNRPIFEITPRAIEVRLNNDPALSTSVAALATWAAPKPTPTPTPPPPTRIPTPGAPQCGPWATPGKPCEWPPAPLPTPTALPACATPVATATCRWQGTPFPTGGAGGTR